MAIGKILISVKAAQVLFGKKDRPTQNDVDALASIRRISKDIKRGVITAADFDGRPILDPFSVGGRAPLMVKFQFNPTELNKEMAIQYNEVIIPGSVQPFIEFIGGKATRVNFELMFFAPMSADMTTAENVDSRFQSAGYVANKMRQLQLLMGQSQRFAPPPFITLLFPNQSDGMSNERILRGAKVGLNPSRLPSGQANDVTIGQAEPIYQFNSENSLKVTGVVEKMKPHYLKFDRFMRPLQVKVEVTLIQGSPHTRKKLTVTTKKTQDLRNTTGLPVPKPCPPFQAVRLSVKTLRDKYKVVTWADLALAANHGLKAGDPQYIRTQCIMDRNHASTTSYSESILVTMRARGASVGLEKAAINGGVAAAGVAATVATSMLAFNQMANLVKKKLDTAGESTLVVVPRQGVFAQAEDVNTRKGQPEEIAGDATSDDSAFSTKRSTYTVVQSSPGGF